MDSAGDASPKKQIQLIREQSKEATRLAIIAAAERVLFRDGWIGGTMEEIAREAGLTKSGVLYYFPSKSDLLGAAMDYQMERRKAFINKRLAEAEPGVPAGRTALLAWLEFITGDKSYVHTLVFLTADPLLRKRLVAARRTMIAEWFAGCVNPVHAAMFFAMVEGMVMDCFNEESAYPEAIRARMAAEIRSRIDKLEWL